MRSVPEESQARGNRRHSGNRTQNCPDDDVPPHLRGALLNGLSPAKLAGAHRRRGGKNRAAISATHSGSENLCAAHGASLMLLAPIGCGNLRRLAPLGWRNLRTAIKGTSLVLRPTFGVVGRVARGAIRVATRGHWQTGQSALLSWWLSSSIILLMPRLQHEYRPANADLVAVAKARTPKRAAIQERRLAFIEVR